MWVVSSLCTSGAPAARASDHPSTHALVPLSYSSVHRRPQPVVPHDSECDPSGKLQLLWQAGPELQLLSLHALKLLHHPSRFRKIRSLLWANGTQPLEYRKS